MVVAQDIFYFKTSTSRGGEVKHNHVLKKCRSCRTVVMQCRCFSKDKEIEWVKCESCKDKEWPERKPMTTLPKHLQEKMEELAEEQCKGLEGSPSYWHIDSFICDEIRAAMKTSAQAMHDELMPLLEEAHDKIDTSVIQFQWVLKGIKLNEKQHIRLSDAIIRLHELSKSIKQKLGESDEN